MPTCEKHKNITGASVDDSFLCVYCEIDRLRAELIMIGEQRDEIDKQRVDIEFEKHEEVKLVALREEQLASVILQRDSAEKDLAESIHLRGIERQELTSVTKELVNSLSKKSFDLYAEEMNRQLTLVTKERDEWKATCIEQRQLAKIERKALGLACEKLGNNSDSSPDYFYKKAQES